MGDERSIQVQTALMTGGSIAGFALLVVNPDGSRMVVYSNDVKTAQINVKQDLPTPVDPDAPLEDFLRSFLPKPVMSKVTIETESLNISFRSADALERLLSDDAVPQLPAPTEDATS